MHCRALVMTFDFMIAFQLLLLHLVCHEASAQSLPEAPSSVTATALGPRTLRVEWIHSGSFGAFATGSGFTITAIADSSTTTIATDENARNYTLGGLTAYNYTSSNGIRYSVAVNAHTDTASSPAVTADTIILPPCPGVCNYRFYTLESQCASGTCMCNSAYSGMLCNVPRYFPDDVQVAFDPREGQDTPELTVKWNQPSSSSLDGRRINNFTVRVYVLGPLVSFQIVTRNYSPNPNASGRNIRVIGDTQFSSTYRTANYRVTVETVTDVANDVASASVNVTTHTPGPVLNFDAVATNASLLITWDRPTDADNLLTGYEFVEPGSTSVTRTTFKFILLFDLTPNTSYTVSVNAINSLGRGTVRNFTASTLANLCAANQYGLPNGTTCIGCPENSVSVVNSQTIDDCQCILGYQRGSSGSQFCSPIPACGPNQYGTSTCQNCPAFTVSDANSVTIDDCQCIAGYQRNSGNINCSPCPSGSYKSTLGNIECTLCPALSTTVVSAGTNQTACSICRYSDGLYPNDTCYYFDTTLPVMLSNVNTTNPVIQVSWETVPQAVVTQDRHEQTPQTYSVSGARINCTSTGRGLISLGYSFELIHDLDLSAASTTLVIVNGLLGLVEYSCFGTLRVNRNGVNQVGPPSMPTTVVTRSTTNTNSALPTILSAGRTGGTSITVLYRIHPSIADLITQLSFFHHQLNRNIETETLLAVPPQGQGPLFVDGLFPDESLELYFLTVVGDLDYRSDTYTLSQGTATTTDSTTTTTDSTTTTTDTTTTPSPSLPAPIISNDNSLPVDGTSVRVVWSLVSDANGYVIYIQREAGEERTERVIGDSVATHVIEDLLPYTEYTVQVAAVQSDGGEGERSAPFIVTTPEAFSGPPVNVIVVEVTGNFINVTWERPSSPNGVITGYLVTVSSDGGNPKNTTYDSSTFSALFSRPDPPYSVKVYALNGAGVGQSANATLMVVPTSKTLPLFTLIVPAAAGGGGSLLLLCCLILVVVTSCYCCRNRKRKGKADFLLKNNTYVEGGTNRNNGDVERGKVPLPHTMTFTNPAFPDDYVEPISSAEEYVPMDCGDTIRIQEEQYEEIPAARLTRQPRSEPALIEVKVKKEATPEDYNNEELYMEMQKVYFEDPGLANPLSSYEFNRADLDFIEEIGHGEFGRVMKASAKSIIPGQTSSIVAVKMLKDDADEKTKKGFMGEATLLAKFGSHPNVMGLLRVVRQSSPHLVIIWYMPHGDLRHYLRKCVKDENSIGTVEQLQISEQVSAGMEYLAGKFFIHRDLAARNVLVGKNNSVKISDFGLSRALAKDDSYYKLSQTLKLPVKWMALESLMYQKFSTYSDVWSYGVLLWEVFSFGVTPYKGIKSMHIGNHVQMGNRLPCPQDCPEAIYQMMLDCWKVVKEERPTFTQLRLKLKAQTISWNRKSTTQPVTGST